MHCSSYVRFDIIRRILREYFRLDVRQGVAPSHCVGPVHIPDAGAGAVRSDGDDGH
jgi:hypothetical protein